jgi:RNA polymerase sigma-32 factor
MANSSLVKYSPDVVSILHNENLSSYLTEIKKYPILSQEEEYRLADDFKNNGNLKAAHKLVTSYLRLVAKIAFSYRHYGLPMADIISEGNIGLMKAVKKFEPEKGFRLSTYAIWWIKATINEFVLASWSLVKIGTVAAQKKLFFKLKKQKEKLGILHNHDMKPSEVKSIADELNVPEKEVVSMNRRMYGDVSLNAKVNTDEDSNERIDFMTDEEHTQEHIVAKAEEADMHHNMLVNAMEDLKEREKYILNERKLKEDPKTLEELAQEFGISRERIRQIENKAFEKVKEKVLEAKKKIN